MARKKHRVPSAEDKARRANPACIRYSNMIEGSPLEKRTTANIQQMHSGRITGLTRPAKRFEIMQPPVEQSTRPSTTKQIAQKPTPARRTGSKSSASKGTSTAQDGTEPPKPRRRRRSTSSKSAAA